MNIRWNIHAEAPILWPPDAKSQHSGKDPDAGKGWGQEKRVEEVRQHLKLNGYELEQTPGDSRGQRNLVAAVHGVTKVGHELRDWAAAKILWICNYYSMQIPILCFFSTQKYIFSFIIIEDWSEAKSQVLFLSFTPCQRITIPHLWFAFKDRTMFFLSSFSFLLAIMTESPHIWRSLSSLIMLQFEWNPPFSSEHFPLKSSCPCFYVAYVLGLLYSS